MSQDPVPYRTRDTNDAEHYLRIPYGGALLFLTPEEYRLALQRGKGILRREAFARRQVALPPPVEG